MVATRFVSTVALASMWAATPALAQKHADTLRFPVSNPDAGIDTYTLPGPFEQAWGPSVFDTLIGFAPENGRFIGHLAKSFTQPDEKTYEFEIRDDVKWHDGQPLTANDVVYTLGYLIDPKVTLRYKAYWGWIDTVEKLGTNKVRIKANRLAPDGLMFLASSTPIYPKHLHGQIENKLDFAMRPVGTGPLRIVQMDKNAGIVAQRYAGFVPGAVKLGSGVGRIIAETINDTGTLTAALLTGQADVAVDLSFDQAQALRDSGRFNLTPAPPGVGLSFLGFPSKGWESAKPLADPRVRTAIIKALDREVLAKIKFGDLAEHIRPLEALCLKEQRGCGYTHPVPAYDPAGARKLLAEAGYADGFDVTIACFPASVPEVTAAAGMLRAVGIRATVRPHPPAQRVQLIRQGKVELGFYGWSGGAMLDVSGQISRHIESNEYEDPLLDKLAGESYTIMDDAERRKAVAKIFDYITEQAYAFAILPNRSLFIHSKEVALNARGIRSASVNPHEFGWK